MARPKKETVIENEIDGVEEVVNTIEEIKEEIPIVEKVEEKKPVVNTKSKFELECEARRKFMW